MITVNHPAVIKRYGLLKELTPIRVFFRGDCRVKEGDIYAPNGLLNEASPAVRIKRGSKAIGQEIRWNRMWYRRRHVRRPNSDSTTKH